MYLSTNLVGRVIDLAGSKWVWMNLIITVIILSYASLWIDRLLKKMFFTPDDSLSFHANLGQFVLTSFIVFLGSETSCRVRLACRIFAATRYEPLHPQKSA